MTQDLINVNLKVLIMDTDFYAMQAVNSYLAWDRRTRVTYMSENPEDMWSYIYRTPIAEQPDVILLDSDHWQKEPLVLHDTIVSLIERIHNLKVLCLGQFVSSSLVEAAADAGGSGFLLKQDVRLQIAWAIVYTLRHDFIISAKVAQTCEGVFHPRIFRSYQLPERREYPELTARNRQAIRLCVVEGMPAYLAADEMGISLHTIRGYIKEGYRIMEAYDEAEYPVDMTPQERAFMRFTAFADENETEVESPFLKDEEED